jgi:hypothetical protein
MSISPPLGGYRSDLVMIPLRVVGMRSRLARNAQKWITAMTMDEDNEEGQGFWDWIVDHYHWNLVGAGHLLDTYFFCDVRDGSLVATISLVRDDRDIGKKYCIPGIWMGGGNVRRESRNQGVMTGVFSQLQTFIQTIVDATATELVVNMFTGTEDMEKIAIRHGYGFQKALYIDHFGVEERWFKRIFQPAEISDAR